MKILVIEDDASLRHIVQEVLLKERYVVETASTYNEAILKIEDYVYDCILLDIMLPDGSGFDLLNYMKENGKAGNVIIISAKDSIEDKVHGLEIGADDYLPKPFHLAELLARIRSVIRRKNNGGEMLVKFGNIVINPELFKVSIAGVDIELSRKEFDILHYFMGRPNMLVNKQVLAEAIWGDHIDQVDNFDFIYAQMKNLRKKMKDFGADSEIKSVYGVGYKIQLL